jgi:hypothetical protein
MALPARESAKEQVLQVVPRIDLPGAMNASDFSMKTITDIREHGREYLHAAAAGNRSRSEQILLSKRPPIVGRVSLKPDTPALLPDPPTNLNLGGRNPSRTVRKERDGLEEPLSSGPRRNGITRRRTARVGTRKHRKWASHFECHRIP